MSADLRRYLLSEVGAARAEQYFEIFEALRSELGYSDYLGALQRYRVVHPRDPHLLAVSSFLVNYPFANRLFPGSLDALEHAAKFGQTVILSDGDVVFQPRKVERAGLFDAVDKRVLIYIHKEHELDDVERRYPADHYVLVDDKIRILTAVKKIWGERLTTVFPRQGHYALAPEVANFPPPGHHARADRRALRLRSAEACWRRRERDSDGFQDGGMARSGRGPSAPHSVSCPDSRRASG